MPSGSESIPSLVIAAILADDPAIGGAGLLFPLIGQSGTPPRFFLDKISEDKKRPFGILRYFVEQSFPTSETQQALGVRPQTGVQLRCSVVFYADVGTADAEACATGFKNLMYLPPPNFVAVPLSGFGTILRAYSEGDVVKRIVRQPWRQATLQSMIAASRSWFFRMSRP